MLTHFFGGTSVSCELGGPIQISGIFGVISPKISGIDIHKSIIVDTTTPLSKIQL
jgi:hypothetical protein